MAASNYIDIKSSGSRQAAETRGAIDNLQSILHQFGEMKLMFDQMALGGDFTQMAGYLGISVDDAQAVYNLWGSANTELNAPFIAQLLSRCG